MAEKSRSNTISLLALFISILCLYFAVTTTTAAESDEVKLLYLTLVWPGALCYSGQCCNPPVTGPQANDFLIEDLKAIDSTGQIIQDCNESCNFDTDTMLDLGDELNPRWMNLNCTCDYTYGHRDTAWCRYGQCSKLPQHDYFQTAVNMTRRANLLNGFKVNNIEPSFVLYDLEYINTTLMANIGFSTHLECGTEVEIAQPLSKIGLCISADGQSFINCPFEIKHKSCNTRHLLFLPFESDKLYDCLKNEAGSGGLIKMATEKHLAM
ncbi:Ribonuclease T(2) protein [Dioscorea alata]|uniref:Ribonuclease T(2) protein n=1 Tax=Dioscorea alata TaxID=55571 RepID=A0ACB7W0Y0_DIOAL|nr:Ribonuclease T(2) protein [Dioscorea alata]